MVEFEAVQQYAWLALSIIAAVGLVPAVNWIKGQLKLSGGKAQLLSAVAAVFVAVLTLIVNGQLTPDVVTPDRIGIAFMLIWGASQVIYKRLNEGKVDDPPDLLTYEKVVNE